MTARFYVTTPIYYITAAPHVGHAYTSILGDVLARYHRMRGHKTHFLTGTDEHGQKVERKAQEQNVPTPEFADRVAGQYRDAWPQLTISHDDFIRTTEPRHEERAAELWKRIADRGDIYLGQYEGWYCVADEAFYTEKELVNGMAPTGRPVERVTEPSYFFRLSKYTDVLLDFYERHPQFVQPESRYNEVKSFVKTGLQDLSVSRTTFKWGIPVPGDPTHVMYVWFDALSNYLTALNENQRHEFWPPDVHLVGKEIARFHAVYWPAFLLAAGFSEAELPKQIFAHGWMTVNGEKMAKTAGNFIDPVEVANEVGADAFRYYLMRAIAMGQDGDFSHDDLLTRYNSELGNDLGNLINRTLGLCAKYADLKTTEYSAPTSIEHELAAAALEASGKAREALDAIAPHRALDAVFALCRTANAYVDKAAPWAAEKKGDKARVGTILASLLEVGRWLSILLEPVIPTKCAEIRTQLGLAPTLPIAIGTDLWPTSWTPRPAGEALGQPGALFPRIVDEQRALLLAKLLPKPAVGTSETTASPTTTTKKPAMTTSSSEPTADASTAANASTEAKPAAEPAPFAEIQPTIDYDTFAKTDIRVGRVLTAAKVPKKDKLLSLEVDIGEPTPRKIIAGLALSFAPEKLVGTTVLVVANLAPRDFGKGLVSHGMLLAAGPSEALSMATVGEQVPVGTKVK